jgi:3'-phosphoadenosine 5'-phosphosulfate sulfotransferase (PAPS reductase)/FAD synthetase
MKKPEYHVASFSGGKDSTAMVLRMIERGDHLDEVMFCDTTMEHPVMLRHVEKVKQVIEEAGIKFTTLRSERDFEYYLTTHPAKNRKPTSTYYGLPGYGWPGNQSRWCTRNLKISLIDSHLSELRETHEVIQYLGIAADEDYRLERETNQNPNHRHPLRDWGWTEADAMQYCRGKGYDWEGLYEIYNRVSCWCCPLSTYDELRNTRKHFPDLWDRLLDLDRRQFKPFAHGYSVADFDRRFALEDALLAAGHSIKNRAFHSDHKRLLAGETTIEEILHERVKRE